MPAPYVAFYAPLKSPDHPVASGDRTVGRLLMRALAAAGFRPELASGLRTFEPHGDEHRQRELGAESEAEADRLIARWRSGSTKPALWFTYHTYYKAPDHLGPLIAARLGIPYVVAEASRATKRRDGPWSFAHRAAEASISAASIIFVSTAHDREALAQDTSLRSRLLDLPPFLDTAEWPSSRRVRRGGGVRLLAVGMMRPGDKLQSYRLLAAALDSIRDLDWTLDIAGDGPIRREVEALFAPLDGRVAFHGLVDRRSLGALYSAADLFVWPAVNEAYGMALLEAQAHGCPVVAGGFGGIASAMIPGGTGLMPRPGDVPAFSAAVADLIGDHARRAGMGIAAERFVRTERNLTGVAAVLARTLDPLLAASMAA